MSTGTNSSKRAPQRSGSSSSRKKMSAKKRKAKQRRRIIFFAVEIVALIVLLIAIVGVNMVTKIDKIKINEEDIVVNPQVENNKEMKGYRNIALFGVDSRKGKLGKGSRSDTVMIASINQDTGDVKLVSVYRDTYLNLGTDSYNKANAAYAQGGPEQAINMLNMNFDLDITEYVTVGFDALIETIDELGGVDIRTLPLAECTKRIAYVAQDNYLFDLSVMDNIRMGRKGATDAEVIDAAKKCGCHEFIMGLENGYQTVCGASGGHLSGGERQRISIARAMLKDAPIVILDEATSYTDPENEAVIQSALGRLVRGKTLLVIAHRLSTIADADQIIVVNQGKIEATGTQAELLASCPLYQTMWEAHISVKDDGEVA